jgi:cell division protease FtsH
VIEEAHMTATEVLKGHSDELHRLSLILIERETIDKDQFERLLAGEAQESVFAEKTPAAKPEPEPEGEKKRKPEPKTRPFPIPGATMQPPPPEGAKG